MAWPACATRARSSASLWGPLDDLAVPLPQLEFPYAGLVAENARRGHDAPEYELVDTGIFHEDRYWAVTVDFAKAAPEDVCIRITVQNR